MHFANSLSTNMARSESLDCPIVEIKSGLYSKFLLLKSSSHNEATEALIVRNLILDLVKGLGEIQWSLIHSAMKVKSCKVEQPIFWLLGLTFVAFRCFICLCISNNSSTLPQIFHHKKWSVLDIFFIIIFFFSESSYMSCFAWIAWNMPTTTMMALDLTPPYVAWHSALSCCCGLTAGQSSSHWAGLVSGR